MIRVFGYLKHCMKCLTICDTRFIEGQGQVGVDLNWLETYLDAVQYPPPETPYRKGKLVIITKFADADHAQDIETRKSVTGVLMLPNNTLIKHYNKRHKTVEKSDYGS